jgi:aspartyl protease family protein
MGQQAIHPSLNTIILRAKFEGVGRRRVHLRMVLDTGASMTVIPWSAAEMLGYDPAESRQRVTFMTGSGMEAAPVVTVRCLEVLGVRVADVTALCHDLPQRGLVDGLLGLSFLRHCRLSLDFQRGVLELSRAHR